MGADRYSYLPSLWIGTPLIAHGLHHLVTKLRLPRSAVFGAAVALLAVYGALTREYAADFATRELLWARAARLDPTDSGAVNQLGLAVQKDGRHAEALPLFRQAAVGAAANPDDAGCRTILSRAQGGEGAIADCEQALARENLLLARMAGGGGAAKKKTKKIKPNAKCPCGSGKKYKKCCRLKEEK